MQKINLFKASAKPKRIWCKFIYMFALLAFIFAIFFSIAGYNFVKNKLAQNDVDDLMQKKNKIKVEMEILEASLPEKGLEKSLKQRAANLGKMRGARERMFRELEKLQKGQSIGFAKYLHALSKYDIDGIWLSKFEFLNEGRDVFLEGTANDVALIPVLISKIGEDSTFQGKRFESLNLSRESQEGNLIKFSLRSE